MESLVQCRGGDYGRYPCRHHRRPGRVLVRYAETPLAVIGGAVIFLPLFVFLPRLIQYAMRADTDALLDAFGKNEQVKKVFWTFFIVTAGLVLARVLDPAAVEKIVGMLAGIVP